jgi:NAD(P)-dependent dehydrogenase (short-subunit alcohol dehydrogenase family)
LPTAIVTGAARGIDEEIARRLHADGFDVALSDVDVAGVERIAAELGERAFEHDVRELRSWEQLVAPAAIDGPLAREVLGAPRWSPSSSPRTPATSPGRRSTSTAAS